MLTIKPLIPKVDGPRDIPNTYEIKQHFHCKNCFDDRPDHLSPRDWCSLEAGWTKQGIQIWCKRCEANVMHMDFDGMKHRGNISSGLQQSLRIKSASNGT